MSKKRKKEAKIDERVFLLKPTKNTSVYQRLFLTFGEFLFCNISTANP